MRERDVRREDRGGVVLLAEFPLHRVEDAARIAVRDRALQTVADLDAERAVVLCDEQEHAVIHPCIADAPAAKEFVRIRLDVRGAERRYGDDDDLRLCLRAKLRTNLFDLCRVCGRDHARRIDDVRPLRGLCEQIAFGGIRRRAAAEKKYREHEEEREVCPQMFLTVHEYHILSRTNHSAIMLL